MTDEQKATLLARLRDTIGREIYDVELTHMLTIGDIEFLLRLRHVRAVERIADILESWDNSGRLDITGGVTAYREE